MTKDAEKLLKYIVDESKHHNNVEVEVNVSAIKDIPNIRHSKNKLLNELEAVGVISGYKENILGEISVYLTTDGLEYFDNLNRDVNSSSIVFNVSGGQVNIANDNGKIEAAQNIYRENKSEKESLKGTWMEIIKQWSEYIDINNWQEWTSYLLGSGSPYLYMDINEKLNDLLQWMFKKIWPKDVKELSDVLSNFYLVLNDFLLLFHEHSELKGNGFYIKKFYHIDNWDDDLYFKLLDRYNNHVILVQDIVLELTRAANYVCDIVREHIDSNYRMEEGKLVVISGPYKNQELIKLCPEYKGNDRETYIPYKGLEQFKKDRYNRDCYFADKKEE